MLQVLGEAGDDDLAEIEDEEASTTIAQADRGAVRQEDFNTRSVVAIVAEATSLSSGNATKPQRFHPLETSVTPYSLMQIVANGRARRPRSLGSRPCGRCAGTVD